VEKINVLDYGFVRLVDHMGSDISVVRAARISHNAAWREGEDQGGDARLIRYLWSHAHTTPFEAVTFTFEAKAPIFVLRQWHRHRTMSYNEVSARYCELFEEFYIPNPTVIGTQDTVNKQGRHTEYDTDFVTQRTLEVEDYRHACEHSIRVYRNLLDASWPRELARCALPVSIYSRMFVTVNLLNLFRFLTLRCDSRAQYEIRVYADAMRELIRPIVPVCVRAWEDYR
jgi:thymidylate synthase (FAD)